ncbi:MAG: DNA polymerase III subunit gamma/tau [Mycoplasmataceae bacterium]|jgi:DNA polymerase-3 subunit gamma/tau|nr:DNA polymerase III subunit gamma/tau [Mycoplasmataceae bacterium]
MSFVSFYKKYRPDKFADVIGQSHLVNTLKNEIKDQKIASVYIFSGPKGNGKTTTARIFAKAINCLHPKKGDACGECENCKMIQEKECYDIIELDAASNNGVNQVREIISNTNYLPTMLKKKVYIIDEAHMITQEAWNALLKTLEDTPEHIVFIFATTEFHKIPSTIVSRSQYFHLSKLNDKELSSVIDKVIVNEKIDIEENAKKALITLANGHARDALVILEQLSANNDKIDEQLINKVYGLVDTKNKINLLNYILSSNLKEALKLTEDFFQKGINIFILVSDLCNILIDKLVFLQTNDKTLLLKTSFESLSSISSSSFKTLLHILNIFEDKLIKIKTTPDATFFLNKAIFEAIEKNEPSSCVQNENEEKPKVEKKNKEKEIKEESKKEVSYTAVDLEGVFSCKEYVIRKEDIKSSKTVKGEEKPQKKEEKRNEKIYNLKDLFLQIAFNYSKEDNALIQNNVDILKQTNNPSFANINDCDKIFIASKKGAILRFPTEDDANLFNSYSLKPKFIESYSSQFGCPIILIGLENKKIDEFKIAYQDARKKGVSFQEINVSDFLTNESEINKVFSDIFQS